MSYNIRYSCVSHVGKIRNVNQDNFICDGLYIDKDKPLSFPLCGVCSSKDAPLFGVFDGMGGEQRGEVASYIAAKTAAALVLGKDAVAALAAFCNSANMDICEYAAQNDLFAAGTTAAMLAFTSEGVTLCNIGDSKVFRFCEGNLEQISTDHVSTAAFGVKPPLSQNLGIPPTELIIDPYYARGRYNDGDIYLICSDGLTDMVTTEEISDMLAAKPVEDACAQLLEKALDKGGRDNTTIIICKVERAAGRFFKRKRDVR